MAVQQQHLERADRIRQAHDDQAAGIRARPELSTEGRNMLLARNYVQARDKMQGLVQSASSDDAAETAKAGRTAFGTAGIPGDPATVAVSYRDAQDRAAGLTSSGNALALLSRAERSGDEPLARAVAGHAHDMSMGDHLDPGWGDVVDTFTASRPSAAAAVSTLRRLAPGRLDTRSMFAFVLPRPLELSSAGAYTIDQLAAKAPFGDHPGGT